MDVSSDNIIKGCKQYNRLAQKLLYEKYAPAMNGICLRYVSNPDTVKDILQEGFIRVFSKIKQYSGHGSFEGWMKMIFINSAISYIRQQHKKCRTLNIEEIEDSVLTEEDEFIDFRPVLSANFSTSDLLKVLEVLPGKFRMVFNLFCIEKLKHEEIAKMLGIGTSTSRTRLLRARHLIQKELYNRSIAKSGRPYGNPRNTPKGLRKVFSHECTNFN